MPAKDHYHDAIVHALIKDGWTIEGEQVTFITVDRQVVIDVLATKQTNRLLIEVKGFQRSPVEELAIAIGKILIYRFVLEELGEDLALWLAIPEDAYAGIFSERMGAIMRQRIAIDLLVFSPEREEVVAWIPYNKS